MDVLDSVPKQLLGCEIKSRTKIILTFLIPVILELLAYLIQMLADMAVTIQHFRNSHIFYGGLTLAFICLPALVCFVSIMTSTWQWPEAQISNSENFKFFFRQLINLLLFPIGAVYSEQYADIGECKFELTFMFSFQSYVNVIIALIGTSSTFISGALVIIHEIRFCRRIFWSIESLFYQKETYERQHSVSKAAETSPFELYHFVQAYTQAAPQIILQLYTLLREDIFRNYETTNVQVLSIVFSLINIAAITMSYQRFESQKVVGRHYPWSSPTQIYNNQRKFHRTRSYVEEIRENVKSRADTARHFPENEIILHRFHLQQMTGEARSLSSNASETKLVLSELTKRNEKHCEENKNLLEHTNDSIFMNITDDETFNSSQFRSQAADEVDTLGTVIHGEQEDVSDIVVFEEISPDSQDVAPRVEDMEFDTIPDKPAPSPPQKTKSSVSDLPTANVWQEYLNPIKRLSTFKNMLVMNAELYIKEHIPHPPRILIERTMNQEHEEKSIDSCLRDNYGTSPNLFTPEYGAKRKMFEASNLNDTTDFFLPKRRNMIKGVEQDDFIGKFVSFFGWIMFIFMRMMSLSMFSCFYLPEFLYLTCAHYGLMLVCLMYETKFQEKIERLLFYLFLAYVYVFVILEFRIKFKHLRQWYVGYFFLVMLQNFSVTILWYATKELDSWWYEFLFIAIITSGLLFLACMVVYYFILKPNDVILLEKE